MDRKITVGELKEKMVKFRDARNWKKYHNPKDIVISINVEAGELLELFQWKKMKDVRGWLKNPKNLKRVSEELADVVLYCLGLSDVLNLDLSDAVMKKIKSNERKYPIKKVHGNYRKYTEIKGRKK